MRTFVSINILAAICVLGFSLVVYNDRSNFYNRMLAVYDDSVSIANDGRDEKVRKALRFNGEIILRQGRIALREGWVILAFSVFVALLVAFNMFYMQRMVRVLKDYESSQDRQDRGQV